jgi:protein phosphatase
MSGMGTTVTVLLIEDGEAHIAHVGDSRCYLLRNKAIMQLTSDHSLAAHWEHTVAITQDGYEVLTLPADYP